MKFAHAAGFVPDLANFITGATTLVKGTTDTFLYMLISGILETKVTFRGKMGEISEKK